MESIDCSWLTISAGCSCDMGAGARRRKQLQSEWIRDVKTDVEVGEFVLIWYGKRGKVPMLTC